MSSAFNRTFKIILNEINKPIFKNNNISFNCLVKQLILEDYHIFPVPKLLLDDIEEFVKTAIEDDPNNFKKEYSFSDLLDNYVKDWDYYGEFVENVKELNRLNKDGKIICCVISNAQHIKEIISQFKLDANFEDILNANAYVFSCHNSENFDVCLCINLINGISSIRKCIQHELIHWMQASLNMHTHSSRGVFNDRKFDLTENDLDFLSNVLHMEKERFKEIYEYLLNGMEFEAWAANTCEEFENSNLSLCKFKDIIENDRKFNLFFNLEIGRNENLKEMFLFGKICQIASKNDKKDDRYWFLIEALNENKKHV